MIRLLLHLIGKKDYESCKSCETLREQLSQSNQREKELTETLLNLIQPKIQPANPVEVHPFTASAGLFSRRRSELERKSREQAAQVVQHSPFIAKIKTTEPVKTDQTQTAGNPGNVAALEQELGVENNG